jgi:hypothetical protein
MYPALTILEGKSGNAETSYLSFLPEVKKEKALGCFSSEGI